MEQPDSLSIEAKRALQAEQARQTQLLVDAYWTSHPNFVCPVTHCRIMLSECWRRQCLVKPQKQAYGSKKADNPFDARCRSGKCVEGLETQRKLGLTKQSSKKDGTSVQDPRAPAPLRQLSNTAKASPGHLPKAVNGTAKPEHPQHSGAQRWVGVLRLRLERVLAVGKSPGRRNSSRVRAGA